MCSFLQQNKFINRGHDIMETLPVWGTPDRIGYCEKRRDMIQHIAYSFFQYNYIQYIVFDLHELKSGSCWRILATHVLSSHFFSYQAELQFCSELFWDHEMPSTVSSSSDGSIDIEEQEIITSLLDLEVWLGYIWITGSCMLLQHGFFHVCQRGTNTRLVSIWVLDTIDYGL